MFERFTERARQVVVLAQDEARLLGHHHIGTEHLLLGLLREEEGLAAQVLRSLEVTIEDVRERIAEVVGRGETATEGQIPFTPRAKKVLELSLREAISRGHDDIATEHVLLGLIREGEGVGCRILGELGADPASVHRRVTELLRGEPALRPRESRRARAEQPRWEYRVIATDTLDEQQLNKLGADRWELLAVTGSGPFELVFRRKASAP